MRSVLENLGTIKHNEGERCFDDLIQLLHHYHLLYWDSDAKAYCFDPALRRVLAENLRLTNPHVYRKAHDAAVDFYLMRLESQRNYLAWNLPEMLFHHYMLNSSSQELPQTTAKLMTRLRDQLGLGKSLEKRTQIEAQLTLDLDIELRELIPDTDMEQLKQMLQSSQAA